MRIALAGVLLLLAFPATARPCFQNPHAKGVVHGVVLQQNGEPAANFTAILDMPGVSLSYVLPQMKTNERGEYRFQHLCPGTFAVLAENDAAGYPFTSSGWYQILYGKPTPEVRITKFRSDAVLIVTLPPKPAKLRLNLVNHKTKEEIRYVNIEIFVDRTRDVKTFCDPALSVTCDSPTFFLLPPDQDVFLHVTSGGFQEWNESVGRGKLVHVGNGELLTLDVELEPIQN
jgi:hypothetical protein